MTNHMERTSNKAAAIAIATVVLLPVIYVLSSGPAVWLVVHEVVPGPPISMLYAPLEWTTEKSDIAKSAIHSYVRLWVGEIAVPADEQEELR